MKNSKVANAIVTVATGVTLAVMVGQIIPVNLLSGSTDFSLTQVNADCCGPHPMTGCPDMTVAPK